MAIIRIIKVFVRKNMARYALIKPCCGLLVFLIIGIWAVVIPFGPIFSNQVWSTSCVAAVCPNVRLSFGAARWMMAGK